jgi:hypothetical protein
MIAGIAGITGGIAGITTMVLITTGTVAGTTADAMAGGCSTTGSFGCSYSP